MLIWPQFFYPSKKSNENTRDIYIVIQIAAGYVPNLIKREVDVAIKSLRVSILMAAPMQQLADPVPSSRAASSSDRSRMLQ